MRNVIPCASTSYECQERDTLCTYMYVSMSVRCAKAKVHTTELNAEDAMVRCGPHDSGPEIEYAPPTFLYKNSEVFFQNTRNSRKFLPTPEDAPVSQAEESALEAEAEAVAQQEDVAEEAMRRAKPPKNSS